MMTLYRRELCNLNNLEEADLLVTVVGKSLRDGPPEADIVTISDLVTLYVYDQLHKFPINSFVYKPYPLQLAGCRRCAELPCDVVGHWASPGKIEFINWGK